MPTVLLSLLLAFGVLMLIDLGPGRAPPFASLVAYRCDIVPGEQSSTPRRAASSAPVHTCRAGDAIVEARGALPVGGDAVGWSRCVRTGGTIIIWREPLPSPYGARIFQTACNERVFFSYDAGARAYSAGHATGLLFAIGSAALAAAGLLLRFLNGRRQVERRPARGRDRR